MRKGAILSLVGKGRILALVLFVAVLAGCQQAPTGPQPLTDADKEAIRAFTDNHAKAHVPVNASTIADSYVEEALRMPPGAELIRGKSEIQKSMQPTDQQGGTLTDLSLDPIEISGLNDLAYVVGASIATITTPGSTTPVSQKGKYVWILKKQPDDSWKMVADIWNFDQPPPQQGESASGN